MLLTQRCNVQKPRQFPLASGLRLPTIGDMKFVWFLALRYLKPRGTFFSVITLLSVLGVLLGVAVLIVVIGVMSGFERTIKQNILGLQPQIMMTDGYRKFDENGNPLPLENAKGWRETIEILKKYPHVTDVQPYISLVTLLEPAKKNGAEPQIASFMGIDPSNKDQIDKIKGMMKKPEDGGGTFDIGTSSDGDSIVINEKLANKLRIGVGSKVNAFSPETMKEVRKAWEKWEETKDKPDERKTVEDQMSKLLVPSEFVVSGIFVSLQHQDYIVFSLESAQTLSGKASEDFVSGLALGTDDPFEADLTLANIISEPTLPENWGGYTWIDANRPFFNAIQNERSMMFMVLMIIVVVAAFSTMISMIIFAVQKRREIGMVRALGATTAQVLGIFTMQGMVIGLIGVTMGAITGKLVLHYRNDIREWLSKHLHIEIFPSDIYGLPELPSYLRNEDLYWICIPAFLLCSLAALIPAMKSASGDPSRELRGGAQ